MCMLIFQMPVHEKVSVAILRQAWACFSWQGFRRALASAESMMACLVACGHLGGCAFRNHSGWCRRFRHIHIHIIVFLFIFM